MYHRFFANFLRLHCLFIPDADGFSSQDVSNVNRIGSLYALKLTKMCQ